MLLLPRFAALNPHGTLDFQLASEGSISEYVGSCFHIVVVLQESNYSIHDVTDMITVRASLTARDSTQLRFHTRPIHLTGKTQIW